MHLDDYDELAAQGCDRPTIAKRLGVTVRTIERHLAAAGRTRRADVPDRCRAHGGSFTPTGQRRHKARGLCALCYMRLRRAGQLDQHPQLLEVAA